jgi:TetR/AcrR family transcriptional regulator, transcriptional repressor for nem operon
MRYSSGHKEQTLAETLAPAAAAAGGLRDEDLEGVLGCASVEAFVERYLRPSHLIKTGDGCPLPALVSKVAWTGGPVKAIFEAIIRDLAARLRSHAGEGVTEDRALAIVALCIGGLEVARSVQNQALAKRILAACRDLAKAGLVADTTRV